ncbi:uncharacterized protein AMSG_11792 [Thecamonas trahens ATCC 50062]|uniref:Uncharacterized protein n=1 Tax=Thecamonas trahens ATCC 50062 TaxID=461836 RepID=A0A0L0D6A6_THETB|nr:hypothetical protein AMSG_11792 [Thecamonas trahens ATCC 50062]KNC47730.1 hypothetical protein AMSG_11792 [Thecamonas trahens ATCC 50062]|eukprot:XP_013759369.1 hypothetical protein AMSG_11792 [Thecamonas trahens ATCC 50062]
MACPRSARSHGQLACAGPPDNGCHRPPALACLPWRPARTSVRRARLGTSVGRSSTKDRRGGCALLPTTTLGRHYPQRHRTRMPQLERKRRPAPRQPVRSSVRRARHGTLIVGSLTQGR